MARRRLTLAALFGLLAAGAGAQTARGPVFDLPSARLAILQAEDRRAPTPRDLALIRSGIRSRDPITARTAIRALGRLERPSFIPDLIPLLRASLPEVRAEAANAIAQAARSKTKMPLGPAVAALTTRLGVEEEPSVRAAICESLGRLPTEGTETRGIEATLVGVADREISTEARVGVAKGLEALVRVHRGKHDLSTEAIVALRRLAVPEPAGGRGVSDAVRVARIRRLAMEALVSAEAADAETLRLAAADPDAQVRRLAMRVATFPSSGQAGVEALGKGLSDDSAMVRLDALRGLRLRGVEGACDVAITAVHDRDPNVVLLALDQLSGCGGSPDAVAALERTVNDLSMAGTPGGWHRSAHAIVALATAASERASAALPQFTRSRVWQLRMYAARAAARLKDTQALTILAADADDNVCEAAVEALSTLAGHAADAAYIAGLDRRGYQAVRASARALAATTATGQTVPALQSAMRRLTAEGRDNSRDARAAIAETLTGLGVRTEPPPMPSPVSRLTADDLQRLSASRAVVTVGGAGTFELALFTSEAPASVARFARLAESGYYNGLTFHRVVSNFVIQGGSPGSNEYIGDATYMRDEVGLWPHVRGAVGISTRGRDTGDAQIFIDLVDNPRLDHEFTVFAQVLNGIDVVDRILEGDVIQKIEIVLGP